MGSTQDFKCSTDFEHVAQHMLPPHSVHVTALHVDVQGNGHSDVAVVGIIYTDQNDRPSQILGTSDAVLVKAHAPRSFVRLPFATAGVSITPKFAGEAVWLGEQAGKPLAAGSRTDANVTDPPGPLDLACYGFPPSPHHRACMYTAQPFAKKPKVSFGRASPCSSSLSVFATTTTAATAGAAASFVQQ